MSETRKPRRCWFQYSLRSLLLLMFLASLGMSWFAVLAKRARAQKQAVEEIRKLGGQVVYDYEVQAGNTGTFPAVAPGPVWLRSRLGVDFFATPVSVGFYSPSVTDDGLKPLEQLTKLRALVLCQPHVTDAGLKHLKELRQLEMLHLFDMPVTDAGLEQIKALTKLQRLNLDLTQITDAGLQSLKGLTELRLLELRSTKVTGQGVKRLQQVLPDCEIHGP